MKINTLKAVGFLRDIIFIHLFVLFGVMTMGNSMLLFGMAQCLDAHATQAIKVMLILLIAWYLMSVAIILYKYRFLKIEVKT